MKFTKDVISPCLWVTAITATSTTRSKHPVVVIFMFTVFKTTQTQATSRVGLAISAEYPWLSIFKYFTTKVGCGLTALQYTVHVPSLPYPFQILNEVIL
jgi:hypothetical protein